ncbi:DUF2637 domain-containing protein [Streptomyces finlayi]|uniref:DUF2637 domain-containing protein n=1 Tax=Streptomyces finlayi TaxID=67296 RepID=A0A7G7BL54_9ACTN|nr:DUF2637 domain-containing protein [Streptomyces finlayi]QNE76069.1 DUF2637 domain-containing protein [Streptomyces finlayi]
MNRTGKTLLVLALVAVVAMAFRVSWNALRDVATATGADSTAALLYPFVVDGLMALALVATLVLTGDARRFALRVLAAYTLASLVLNYVHGLVPELHSKSVDWGRLADWDPANWALVLLATSLPVGSIYFGSDLVAKVLHHQPTEPAIAEETTETTVNRSTSDLRESTPAPVAPVDVPPALPAPEPVEELPSAGLVPVGALAAESTRPRRATGRVPDVARSSRPVRTADQLLTEARSATADWPVEELTGEAIRKAVHTSAAKARVLRETLRAERTTVPDEAVA